MGKGVLYFFLLWARNFAGHFRKLFNLAKTVPPIGALAALIVAGPVIGLSIITSLLKTVTDYISRKSLSKEDLTALKEISIKDRLEALDAGDVTQFVTGLIYKKRSFFSTMSRSTHQILVYFAPLKMNDEHAKPTDEQVKARLIAYMTDKKNVYKGYFNSVAHELIAYEGKRTIQSPGMGEEGRALLSSREQRGEYKFTKDNTLTSQGSEARQLPTQEEMRAQQAALAKLVAGVEENAENSIKTIEQSQSLAVAGQLQTLRAELGVGQSSSAAVTPFHANENPSTAQAKGVNRKSSSTVSISKAKAKVSDAPSEAALLTSTATPQSAQSGKQQVSSKALPTLSLVGTRTNKLGNSTNNNAFLESVVATQQHLLSIKRGESSFNLNTP